MYIYNDYTDRERKGVVTLCLNHVYTKKERSARLRMKKKSISTEFFVKHVGYVNLADKE